jgi:hypothetical protein
METIESDELHNVKELIEIIKKQYKDNPITICYGFRYLIDKIFKNNSFLFYIKSEKTIYTIIQNKNQNSTIIIPERILPFFRICKTNKY